MKLLFPLFLAALLFNSYAAALPADTLAAGTKESTPVPADDDVIPNSYLVQFKPGVDDKAQRKAIADAIQRENAREDNDGIESKVVYDYNIGDGFKGFAGTLTPRLAGELKADPAIAIIEPDRKVHASAMQYNPPSWGLTRISEQNLDLSQPYIYPDSAGAGTTVYVIDSGILTSHPDFQGRAVWGITTCLGCSNTDDNGHGTHVAGTVGSTTYGVAKKTKLVAVKVLDANGSGSWAGVIAGIEWVGTQTQLSGKTSVANMSLGGGKSILVNTAVQSAIAMGVTMAVAAGNENQDACNVSPASTPEAITVAASTQVDYRASFSNWGPCVDIFAPGQDITSTWNNGGTNTISGTSMASPHVAGAAALFLGVSPGSRPADVANFLYQRATFGKINDTRGSINRLLFVFNWGLENLSQQQERQ